MYLLTWNPSRWDWTTLEQDIATLKHVGELHMTWSCGRTRRILAGDRLFLMRLGVEPKGILGSALAMAPPFVSDHWDSVRSADGETGLFVEAAFDHLEAEPVITFEELGLSPFATMKWTPQASGTSISGDVADALEQLWARRTGAGGDRGPDEMIGDALLLEGATRSVAVNAHERNRVARRRCLEHYGATCFSCGMSFGAVYGEYANGYMHVHHVRQLSTVGEEYVVDPITDLRPLCPNCHAAVHLSSPMITPEELRHLLDGRRPGG